MSEQNKNITIMVADDEEIVLSLVSDTLEDEGYNVITSIDSYECLALFDKHKIDILISDIRMPNMNGIELVKRAKEKQPNIAIVFMTGYANLNSAKDAIKQGASDYILKPFELHEIRNAVEKATAQVNKENQNNTEEFQLDHLNDLNEMLFTVGDKISQIQMSLKFAVSHSKADFGSFLYWNNSRTEFKMITTDGEKASEKNLPVEYITKIVGDIDYAELSQPSIIHSSDDNPLLKTDNSLEAVKLVVPNWYTKEFPMVMIRVSRASSIYGILMINAPSDSKTIKESNLKFLSITAQQLALSLENIELLEESQSAYHKLKELQDDTIQLEKMATKGEMSAEIGHELNNFLGVVAGSLSLLEYQIKQKKYDKLDKHLNAMNDNIDKIKKFTSNLMDLRPISTKSETIFFHKMLTEVIDYLKPQKRYQGVNITFKPCQQDIQFNADTLHIQQLLYNLFNNAADAMLLSETKEILVKTDLCEGKNSFLITITDTGEGLSEENIEKAFSQKFTTKKTGHGFGLLVCKRIIESHQGSLQIKSKIGEGTTISIEFPLEKNTVEKEMELVS